VLDNDDGNKLTEMLRKVYKPERASPEFKERLRKRLIDAASSQPQPQPLWRRPLVWAPVAAALALALIAYFAILPAFSPGTSGYGTLEIRITDAPTENFTAVWITISDVQVHKASDNAEDEDGWITVASENMTFELLELGREEEEELLASATIEAGRYTQMRITVTEVKIAIDGQTVDGPVKLPSGELKFLQPVAVDFDVQAGETRVLLLDFDARKSLSSTGQGMYMFNPVVTPSLVE
jgi:hypothetical protein